MTRLERVPEGHLTHLQDRLQDSPEAETSLLVARLPVGQILEGLSVPLVHRPQTEQGGVLLEAGVVVAYVPLELPTPEVGARSHSRHRCLLLPSRRHRRQRHRARRRRHQRHTRRLHPHQRECRRLRQLRHRLVLIPIAIMVPFMAPATLRRMTRRISGRAA